MHFFFQRFRFKKKKLHHFPSFAQKTRQHSENQNKETLIFPSFSQRQNKQTFHTAHQAPIFCRADLMSLPHFSITNWNQNRNSVSFPSFPRNQKADWFWKPTWRAPTTVLQFSCCCEPEKRVPMYSIATKYLWSRGFWLMVTEATESCSSPSLRSSVLAIFEGLWEGCPDESDGALSEITGEMAWTSDIDALNQWRLRFSRAFPSARALRVGFRIFWFSFHFY